MRLGLNSIIDRPCGTPSRSYKQRRRCARSHRAKVGRAARPLLHMHQSNARANFIVLELQAGEGQLVAGIDLGTTNSCIAVSPSP